MAYTPKDIANIGLVKIAANLVNNLDPPKTQLEKLIALGFDHWRDDELTQRRWVFARTYVTLTPSEVLTDTSVRRRYVYSLPVDCLYPWKTKHSTWIQYGDKLHDTESTLRLTYTRRVETSMLPPTFVEVLGCRIAKENVEAATQSNTKQATADANYDRAVAKAGRINAYILEVETIGTEDEHSDWLTARWGC